MTACPEGERGEPEADATDCRPSGLAKPILANLFALEKCLA
jgi:hypothetical protein